MGPRVRKGPRPAATVTHVEAGNQAEVTCPGKSESPEMTKEAGGRGWAGEEGEGRQHLDPLGSRDVRVTGVESESV